MKSSEAKPLSAEELQTLQSLFQRWALVSFPCHDGSGALGDAFETYDRINGDAKLGHIRQYSQKEIEDRRTDDGETEL